MIISKTSMAISNDLETLNSPNPPPLIYVKSTGSLKKFSYKQLWVESQTFTFFLESMFAGGEIVY
jgi:hypothetical protein